MSDVTSTLGEGSYTIIVNADQAIAGLQKFQDSVKNTEGSVKTSASSMASSMVGLASSSAALYFSFDQLERSSIRVEQAHLRVEKAQDTVNKLQKEGKEGTDQYAQAMQNLQIQQERYGTAQDMVSENMVFMSLSMVTLATSTIPSAIKAVQGLTFSTEAFGAALDTVAPYLLAATAAFLAWEYAITPVIKAQTGLDLGIQSNIEKLMKQHSTVQTTISDMGDLSSSYGTLDNSIQQSTSSFDSWGSSIASTASKVMDLDQALSGLSLMNHGIDPFGDLSQNDTFTKLKDYISQVQTIESDIKSFMSDGKSQQEAISIIMDHYLLQLQEEKDRLNESNDQYQRKVDLLKQAVEQATKLTDVTNTQLSLDKKKQQVISDLALSTGLPESIIAASFTDPGGFNANSALHDYYLDGLRNFGDSITNLNNPLSAFGISLFGGVYNPESVGNGGMRDGNGVNTSSLLGGLHNDDIWNSLVTMVANEHMFPGVSIDTYNGKNAQAINNGEGLAQSIFEQNSAQWQQFYALRNAGLFTGDPSLSLEENLDNASKVYSSIFTGLRPDVASALEAANEQSYSYQLYADARSPGIRVTRYQFSVPDAASMELAKADSRYSSEQDFQTAVNDSERLLGLTKQQIEDSLTDPHTLADIQSELDYVNRLAAMSSGATG